MPRRHGRIDQLQNAVGEADLPDVDAAATTPTSWTQATGTADLIAEFTLQSAFSRACYSKMHTNRAGLLQYALAERYWARVFRHCGVGTPIDPHDLLRSSEMDTSGCGTTARIHSKAG